MDEKQLRKYAGLEESTVNESAVVSFRAPDDGPNITLSVGDIFNRSVDRREAGFSSFKVKVDKKEPLPTAENSPSAEGRLKTQQDKLAKAKLKEITRLAKIFQAEIKKVLEK